MPWHRRERTTFPPTRGFLVNRTNSLKAWNFNTLVESGVNIREKLVLFWHNHFAIQISVARDPNFAYHYSKLLRDSSLGNFKDLVGKITIDSWMLDYLNGHTNRLNSPNENYARELFELFTIGKGDLAGPGDYTTFTETDVVEAAKVLTGWRYFGRFSKDFLKIL